MGLSVNEIMRRIGMHFRGIHRGGGRSTKPVFKRLPGLKKGEDQPQKGTKIAKDAEEESKGKRGACNGATLEEWSAKYAKRRQKWIRRVDYNWRAMVGFAAARG